VAKSHPTTAMPIVSAAEAMTMRKVYFKLRDSSLESCDLVYDRISAVTLEDAMLAILIELRTPIKKVRQNIKYARGGQDAHDPDRQIILCASDCGRLSLH